MIVSPFHAYFEGAMAKKLHLFVLPAFVVALFLVVVAHLSTRDSRNATRTGGAGGEAGRGAQAPPPHGGFAEKLPPLEDYMRLRAGLLRDPSPEVRQKALDELLPLVPDELEATQAVGRLLLEDKEDEHRSDTLLKLAGLCGKHLGPRGKALAPFLGKIFLDGDDSWIFAVRALRGMGPEANASIPDLIEALRILQAGGWDRWTNTGDPFKEAVLALGAIGGPEAASAAPIVTEIALSAEDALEEASLLLPASFALGRLGPECAGPLVKRLRPALGREDPRIRLNVLEALAEIGPQARGILPALVKALDDGDEMVRRNAARAILRTSCAGNEKAVSSILLGTVNGGGPFLRGEDADRLRKASAPARAVLATLEALANGDGDFEYWASWCLAESGGLDPGIARELGEALRNKGEDYAVRCLLMDALKNLGAGAEPALAAVMERARNGDGKAVEVLGSIGRGASPAVGLLVALLHSEKEELRWQAAEALALIGATPVAVRPLLSALAGRSDLYAHFFHPYCYWDPADSFCEDALPRLVALYSSRCSATPTLECGSPHPSSSGVWASVAAKPIPRCSNASTTRPQGFGKQSARPCRACVDPANRFGLLDGLWRSVYKRSGSGA